MGFDNECILNIQSLAGEYFCPVCRLLVYPNEAIQSQCTHLYCKPCLTYIVGTTRACPYDGYLVTEADSKPLIESNKALAETIGKIAVHCLYHRSGCTWQGQLSECITHCAGCAFGNSPVVCNRCGTQIVHRQVQEHAQNCPGVQPQAQQAEGIQDATASTGTTAAAEQNQTTTQAGASSATQAQASQAVGAPTSTQDQSQTNTNSQPQAAVQAVPTPEQWYQQQQQQYQQYYQQYPGYDPYQQHYQQYDPYQQQAYQQYQQQQPHAHPPQGLLPQVYMQPQPQQQAQPAVCPQPQAQLQSQPQLQPQPQPQPHAHPQAQVGVQPQVQAQVNPPQQLQPNHPHPQMQPQTYPPPHGQHQPQLYSQAQPHPQPNPPQMQAQSHLQQRPQVPHPHHPQPHQQTHPYPHSQPPAQTQLHPQSQVQHHTNVQMQPQSQPQPQQPPSHAVTGHQSYPQPQPHQQIPPGAPQQHPMHMHPQQQGAPHQLPQHTVQMQAQLPQQQLLQMRPPHSQVPMQHQQQPAMLPPQGPRPNMPLAQQPVRPHAQPNQPIQQHPGMHPPHQQNVSQQQVHGHSLHPQAFAGQTPGLVQNMPQQPGPFMQQQAMQPQLRPLVPPASLPLASAHTHQQLQQNVPISHGLQSHHSQNHAGRPMLPHQPFHPSQAGPAGPAHAKPMQSGGIQPYPPRSNIRPQSSSEQQFGHVHQAVPPQSGSETVPFPASPVPLSGSKTQVSTVQSAMKPDLQADAVSQKNEIKEANVLLSTSSQGAGLVELKTEKSENESKSMNVDDKPVIEVEGTSSKQELDVKEISDSSQALEKDPLSLSQDGSDEPVVKKMVKEEETSKSDTSAGGTLAETADQGQDENSQLEDKEVQGDVQKTLSLQQIDAPNGKDVNVQKNATDLQMRHTGSRSVPPSSGPTHERMLPHLGYQERNLFQPPISRQGPSHMQASFLQPGHVASVPENQQLPMNCGPSHMLDRVHQRPPVPDQMLQQPILPHQLQVPGPPPIHMRPQGNNILGNLPPQGQPSSVPPHFQQPIAKQPYGSIHPEVPPGGIIEPGSSSSFGRGSGPFGPSQRSFEPPPSYGAPPPGTFESQGSMMARLASHGQQIPSNHMESELYANKRTGYFDGRQPDSHLPGSVDRVAFGPASGMQSNIMKMNGGSGRALSGGFSDPSFPFGLQDERFKPLPEERYRRLPEEGFNPPGEEHVNPFSVESGRRIIDRREFFDDLKHFPRPTQLDAEPGPKSESYFSSSRPLERGPHGLINDVGLKMDGSASAAASRLLPPYQAGGLRAIDLRDENMGRKIDPIGVHPDFHRSASESGRHRMDGLPPLRSPGREYSGIPTGRFGRVEDIDGRESRAYGERSKSDSNAFLESRFPILPSHLRRGEPHGPGNLRSGEHVGSGVLPFHFRGGDLVGPDILPSHLRSGELVGPRNLHMGEQGGFGTYPNPLRLGDVGGPGNLPLNLRMGESVGGNLRPGFSTNPIRGYANDAGLFNAGDMESFDHSRKRKPGSMGWCRICKVDCETVEGLELHSQTREHQKMAMDMVLTIKKDNAKKQKLSSEDNISHEEDANRAKKASFESHGN